MRAMRDSFESLMAMMDLVVDKLAEAEHAAAVPRHEGGLSPQQHVTPERTALFRSIRNSREKVAGVQRAIHDCVLDFSREVEHGADALEATPVPAPPSLSSPAQPRENLPLRDQISTCERSTSPSVPQPIEARPSGSAMSPAAESDPAHLIVLLRDIEQLLVTEKSATEIAGPAGREHGPRWI